MQCVLLFLVLEGNCPVSIFYLVSLVARSYALLFCTMVVLTYYSNIQQTLAGTTLETKLTKYPRPCPLTHEDFLAYLLYMFVVTQHGEEALQSGKLTVQPQQKEHEEKQDGPKRSARHAKKGFTDNHKCQTRALEYLRGLGGKSPVLVGPFLCQEIEISISWQLEILAWLDRGSALNTCIFYLVTVKICRNLKVGTPPQELCMA